MGGARKWTLSTALVLTMLLVLSIAATAADEPTIDLISATDAKPGGITTVDFDLNGWDDYTVLTITVDVFSASGSIGSSSVLGTRRTADVALSEFAQEGQYNLRLTVTGPDVAPVSKVYPDAIWVDNTKPTAVSSLSAITPTQNKRPTWEWDVATDAHSGVAGYKVKLNDGAWSALFAATAWTPASDLAEGTHTLAVVAVDNAGNEGPEKDFAVVVDFTPPTNPVLTALPAYLSGLEFTIKWSATDVTSGIRDYQVEWSDDATFADVLGSAWTEAAEYTIEVAEHGEYFYRVRARDNANNASAWTAASVTLVAEEAEISIALTPAGSNALHTNNQKPTIDVTVAFPPSTEGESVELYINDGDAVELDLTGGTHVPAQNLPLGFNTVRVVATDVDGVVTTFEKTILVDTTAPTISGAIPASDKVVLGDSAISAAFADAGGASIDTTGVTITVNGVDVTDDAEITAAGVTYAPDVALADGAVNVVVSGLKDSAGNAATALSWTYTADNTGPAVGATTPEALTKDRTPEISAQFSDVAGVDVDTIVFTLTSAVEGLDDEIALSAIAWDADNSTATVTPISALEDGRYVVTVKASDVLGNEGDLVSWEFEVDSLSPVVADVMPESGTWLSNPTPTIGVAVIDRNAVQNARLVLDGEELEPGPGPLSWDVYEFFFPVTSNLAEGEHTVTFYIEDILGNATSSTWTFGVDTIAPKFDADSLEPEHGATVTTRTPTVSVAVSDDGSGIDPESIAVSGLGDVDVAINYADGVITIQPEAELDNGVYDFWISVRDYAWNYATYPVSFTVEATGPEAIWNFDDNAWSNTTSRTIQVTLADPDGVDSDSIELLINGQAVEADIAGNVASYEAEGLVDGDYTVTVVAADELGNYATHTRTFRVDRVRPAITLNAPINGSWVAGTFDVSATVSDDRSGVDSVELRLNGDLVAHSYDDETGEVLYTAVGETGPIATLQLVVTDRAGNTMTQTWSANVDAVAPTFSDNSPVGVIGNAKPTISVKVDDDHPITAVSMTLDEDTVAATYNEATGVISYTPAAALAEGEHTVVVSATDIGGNKSALEWEFVIDLTGPSISVQSPTGDYVASSDVLIEALVDDEVAGVDKVEVRVDGGAWASATQTAPGVWSYEAEGLADGEYVIWVRATDNAGNQSAEAFTIAVDATAPEFSEFAPAQGVTVGNRRPTVSAKVVDNFSGIDVDSIELKVSNDNVTWYDVKATLDEATGLLSGTATEALNAGVVYVALHVADNAGNAADETWSFVVANEAPIVTAPTPTDGSTLGKGDITVSAEVESANGVASWTMIINGAEVDATLQDDRISYVIEQADLVEGDYSVSLMVVDEVGANSTALNWSFTVDLSGPEFKDTYPRAQQTVNSKTPEINATVDDALSAVATVEAKVDNGDWTAVPFVTAELTAGVHTVQFRAIDEHGNETKTDVMSFTVDVTAPSVEITAPEDGALLNESAVVITAKFSDVGTGMSTGSIRVTANGDDVEYDWVIDENDVVVTATYLAEDGDVVIEVSGQDGAGNAAEASVTVTVDTTAPEFSDFEPADESLHAVEPVISVNVSDGAGTGLDEVELVVTNASGEEIEGEVTDAGSVYTFQPDEALADGVYTVSAVAKDNVGNTASVTWSFTLDTTGPVFVNDSREPAPDTWVTTSLPTFSVQVHDGAGVGVRDDNLTATIDGVAAEATLENGVVTVTPTSEVADGAAIAVSISIDDELGNVTNYTWNIGVDTKAPGVVVPYNGSATSNPLASILTAFTDDMSGIDLESIVLRVNGVDVTAQAELDEIEDGVYFFVYSPQEKFADGTVEVEVSVKDKAGLEGTASGWLVVDTTAPTISNTEPVGLGNDPQPEISATVHDLGVGIDETSLKLTVDGTERAATYDAETGKVSWQAPLLDDGKHVVKLEVADALGNKSSETWEFVIDTTPPAVPTNLTVKDYVPGPDALLIWDSQPGAATYTVEWSRTDDFAEVWGRQDGIEESEFYVPGLAEGTWYFRVSATDAAGNESAFSAPAVTYVDTTPPTLAVVGPTGYLAGSPEEIVATYSDDASGVDLDTLVVTVEGAASGLVADLEVVADDDVITVTLGEELADDTYTVTITVSDAVGNESDALTWQFTVDTVAPDFALESELVNDARPVVNIVVLEDGSGLDADSILVELNGVEVDHQYDADAGLITVQPTTDLTDGPHTLEVSALDRAGNAGVKTLTFEVDTVAPAISNVKPSGVLNADDLVDGKVVISANVADAAEVTVAVNDELVEAAVADGVVTAAVALADGEYTVVITATDVAGNVTEATTSFKLDATPPVISNIWPEDGSQVTITRSTISFVATGYDQLILVVDGNEIAPGLYTKLGDKIIYAPKVLFPTGKTITVEVTLVDAAGNVTTARSEFVVKAEREGFGFGRIWF